MHSKLSGITQIDNSDADELRAFLIGNKHIFNGLNTKIEAPKPFNITKKRKLSNSASSNQHEPAAKKQKIESTATDNSENGNSLFTEHYDVHNVIMNDDQKRPFWQTLADPIPNTDATDGGAGSAQIDWKRDYRSKVRESSTRNSILKASNNKSFRDVATLFPKISRSLQRLISSNNNPIKANKVFVHLSQSQKAQRAKTEKPIIIVPHSNNALLNFSNCLAFLSKNQYVKPSHSSMISMSANHKKMAALRLEKKSKLNVNAKNAIFEIRSSSSFSKETDIGEWNRIAAIFVIGKSWQFKQWINGFKKPEKIFSKCCGFYMHFDDDPPSGDVSNWRVNYLPIRRNQRHEDARIAQKFWKALYDHLRTKHRNKKLYY